MPEVTVTAHLSPSASKSVAQLAACAAWLTIIIYSKLSEPHL